MTELQTFGDESFAELFEGATEDTPEIREGTIVKGTVVDIIGDYAVVDVGLCLTHHIASVFARWQAQCDRFLAVECPRFLRLQEKLQQSFVDRLVFSLAGCFQLGPPAGKLVTSVLPSLVKLTTMADCHHQSARRYLDALCFCKTWCVSAVSWLPHNG